MYQVILICVREDVTRSEVVKNLATLFKTTPEQVEKMLATTGFVLKKGVTSEVAGKYKAAIEAAGATCRMEWETLTENLLDVDLPQTSPSEERPRMNSRDTKSSHTNTLLNTLAKQWDLSYILGLLSLGLAAYSMWIAFGPNINLVDNKLENSLKIGKSTKIDFQKFRDQGGLDNDSQSKWRGYQVGSVIVSYANNNKIDSFKIGLKKSWFGAKLASADNLRSSLKGECGSDWRFDGDQYHAKINQAECIIWEHDADVDVLVETTKK